MFSPVAFYYGYASAAFEKPYTRYLRPPVYLKTGSSAGCIVSSPFILNYMNRRYNFSALVLPNPMYSKASELFAAYSAVIKPARQLILPVLSPALIPIALYYATDRRATFYKLFFFNYLLQRFFSYKLFQLGVFRYSSHLSPLMCSNYI